MPGITIHGLFEDWLAGHTSTAKTADEYRTITVEFETFLLRNGGISQAVQVQKRHVSAYRDHLTKKGLMHRTVLKRLGVISTLFNVAVEDDRLTLNPCNTVKVKGKKEKGLFPFEVAELNVFFSSADYISGKGLPRCGRDASHWVSLIGMLTGARIEEICQLSVLGIREDPGLGPYFWIFDGENQTLKNESSRRRVLVHQQLLNLGILVFRDRMKSKNWAAISGVDPTKIWQVFHGFQ
jgi:site-specific recombinase XerD